jgi:threonine aldolase
MGNLAAVLTLCNRGDEVIMGNLSHTFLFEGGGISALGGVHPHTLPNRPDGTLDLDSIRSVIRQDDPHYPISRLVILENTHNRCGGVPLSVKYMRQVGMLCKEHGLFLHLDGARIFNAATAQGVSAAELAGPADSVTFCLSKGLCAPVGSLLCGSAEFVAKARRIRKQLGGGMRQAGVIAAAGIVALEEMTARLGEDHQRASRLAEGLKSVPGLTLETDPPATNMVFVRLNDNIPLTGADFVQKLADKNVLAGLVGPRSIRLVLHYWIRDEDVESALAAVQAVIEETEIG